MDDRRGNWLVTLAEAGNQRALDQLVELYLPLVYNILGHALIGSALTEDDVEQLALQTALRAAEDVDGLPDRTRIRAWFAVAAVERVRELRDTPESLPGGAGAHSADFVDVTVSRLKLSGQRQEIAEATRWLDDDDRELLSLWWLEESGVLTRGDLETAFGLTAYQAEARITQLRERVDAARWVVRVLKAAPPCADLILMRLGWDGRPEPERRAPLHRHMRTCRTCTRGIRLAPAGLLLAGLTPVSPPAITQGAQPLPGGDPDDPDDPDGDPGDEPDERPRAWRALPAGPAHAAVTNQRKHRLPTPHTPVRRVAAVAVAASIVAALLAVATRHHDPAPSAAAAPTAGPAPALLNTQQPQASAQAPPMPVDPTRVSLRPSPPVVTGPVYGSAVDGAEPAPPSQQWPAQLPGRATGPAVTAVGGSYQQLYPDTPDGWKISRWGDTVALRGTGYFALQWGIFPARRIAPVVMPTWTGLRGKLFHVASGGGHRMDDPRSSGPGVETDATWMGQRSTGYCTLPAGAQQMWQSEYYYLDGEVVLHNNETGMDYDLGVSPATAEGIRADLTGTMNPTRGRLRYGVMRDPGDDSAPVPQYLTRERPEDQNAVAQYSRVT